MARWNAARMRVPRWCGGTGGKRAKHHTHNQAEAEHLLPLAAKSEVGSFAMLSVLSMVAGRATTREV